MKKPSRISFGQTGDSPPEHVPGRRRLLGCVTGLLASSVFVGERLPARMPLVTPRDAGCTGSSRGTPELDFVLEAHVTVAPGIELGRSIQGDRRIVPITGGTFHGPRLSGTVLHEGEDSQLLRPDGVKEITARYVLLTHDDVRIYVVNCGLIAPAETQDPGKLYKRTTPRFVAPLGSPYTWLNQAVFVGTLHRLPTREHAVVLRFFKVV